jgi:hypothetical protein
MNSKFSEKKELEKVFPANRPSQQTRKKNYEVCKGDRFADVRFEFTAINECTPVTVAERSEACTVFAGSEAGIAGSNHTQGIDV